MAHVRLVSVNGTGGAFTPVSFTIPAVRVEIIEDGSVATGQGIQYQIDDDTATPFTTTYTILPQTEPIILGQPVPTFGGMGLTIGRGVDQSGGYTLPATLMGNFRSATTTATVLRITEFIG